MSFVHRITQEDIRRTDASDMAGHIAQMGEHIRNAMKSFAASAIKVPAGNGPVIIIGMGGSAIGGELVRCYLAPKFSRPIFVHRGYSLPAFADADSIVIASSYSGNTEETLSAFEQAAQRKIPIIAITTGGTLGDRAKELGIPILSQPTGLQPRAALAYSFVPMLLLLEQIDAGTNLNSSEEQTNLARAATFLDTFAERYGFSHLGDSNIAFKLAGELSHRIPVIYAPSDFEAVALRWRGQIHENAKHVAFCNTVPEMNHNEIEGWGHPIDLVQHFSVLFLRSPEDEHARIADRFAAMHEVFQSKQVDVLEVTAEGATRLERVMSLVSLADWTSLYLALFAGIDPTEIPAIDMLKQKLAALRK